MGKILYLPQNVFVLSCCLIYQIVRVLWRWVHQVDRSKLMMCWRVCLMVILSRVISGLTVTVSSCPILVQQRCSENGSTWPVQLLATSLHRAEPASASLAMLSVSCTNYARLKSNFDKRGLILITLSLLHYGLYTVTKRHPWYCYLAPCHRRRFVACKKVMHRPIP